MIGFKCLASMVILFCLVGTTLSLVRCPSLRGRPGDFCPMWMTHTNGSCMCDKVKQTTTIFKCNQEDRSLTLQACYCVSYYRELNQTLVGNCLYSCITTFHYTVCPHQSHKICLKYNRQGELCGKCIEEMGYPMYSDSVSCINCTTLVPGMFKYAAMAFIPLTIFYVVVIVFRISATSEKLVGYVMVSQILAMPAQLRYLSITHNTRFRQRAINIAISIHSIWNLDFFKSYYSPFCFNNQLSSIETASLNYIIALYPLCLILVTYILIRIHDKYYTLTSAWEPVQSVFSHIRHQCNIKKSLVDVFVTFHLLSYMKILNTSFDILMPTKLYTMQGIPISRHFLFYDGSQMLFKGEHQCYIFLAVIMFILFNAFPLLLLILYPFRCFQSLLNRCGRCRFQLMHTFMDSYQGCYKLYPIDCRHFSAVQLLVRLANLVVFSVTLNRFYHIFASTIFLALAALVVILKPYRDSRQNTLDVILYLITAFGYLSATGYALTQEHSYSTVLASFTEAATAMIFVYILFVLLYKPAMTLCGKLKAIVRHSKKHLQETDEALFSSIQDRTENTPLLETDALTEAKEMTKSIDKTE